MQSKLTRFLVYLFAFTLVFTLCRWVIMPKGYSMEMLTISQLLFMIYMFTPAIAVLIVEDWKFSHLLAEYRITLRNISARALAKYIALAAIGLPALLLFFISVFGNLLEIGSFGSVSINADGGYTMNGMELSDNATIRFITLCALTLGWSLLSGLTYHMLFAVGGEVAWRGFLEKNINLPHYRKYTLIGLIWGLWWAVPTIFPLQSIWSIMNVALVILFCIITSFFLANALKQTRSIFAPAAIMGIHQSFMIIWMVSGSATADFRLIGSTGLLMSVSMLILNVAFTGRRAKS